ncbi:MAG TPA: hypothetical protein VFG76_11195, partial [Candidatus Polarisedimenticolia bacterium]|nr:hypothetical protein [Candidatus Polarisedimenticolia bacterium]
MRVTLFLASFFVASAVLPAVPADTSASWKLAYDVTVSSVPRSGTVTAGKAAQPSEDRFRLEAVLGTEWLLVREDGTTTLHDFQSRRTHVVDDATGKRDEFSLFVDPGARLAEIENRRYLGEVLNQMGGSVSADLRQDETELGVESDPPAGAKFTFKEDKGDTIVRSGKYEVARWHRAEAPVPAGAARSLRRLVARMVPLHPRVRAKLFENDHPPTTLTARVGGMTGERTVSWTLTLSEAAPEDPRPGVLARPRGSIDGEGAAATAARHLAGTMGPAPALETYYSRADAALAEGHLVDAALVELEAMLASGVEKRDRIRRLVQLKDPAVGAL